MFVTVHKKDFHLRGRTFSFKLLAESRFAEIQQKSETKMTASVLMSVCMQTHLLGEAHGLSKYHYDAKGARARPDSKQLTTRGEFEREAASANQRPRIDNNAGVPHRAFGSEWSFDMRARVEVLNYSLTVNNIVKQMRMEHSKWDLRFPRATGLWSKVHSFP